MNLITTLQELREAIDLKVVKANLDNYAIGIFAYEQSRFQKVRAKEQSLIYQALKILEKSSVAYLEQFDKLKQFDNQADLVFSEMMCLFIKLYFTHPKEAKCMIEAVLLFDTLGRSLLANNTVMVDSAPLVLGTLLDRCGIDTTGLVEIAQKNQLNTLYLQDEVCLIESISSVETSSELENISHLSSDVLEKMRLIQRLRASVRRSDSFYHAVMANQFDFDIVSQQPTKENTAMFLSMLSEIFAHAKMQDTGKLYTLLFNPPPGARVSDFSVVAFIQNTMSGWLIFSLVQAPTVLLFDQRLQFIMAVLAQLNHRKTGLPAYATADIYLPFFMLAQYIGNTKLKFHPLIQAHLPIINEMNKRHTAQAITTYTNQFFHSRGLRTKPLKPMRMHMTTQIEWTETKGSMGEITPAKKVEQMIAKGKIIYNYFNPKRQAFRELMPMSTASKVLWNAQSIVDSTLRNLQFADMLDLIKGVFQIYSASDTLEQQLQSLARGLIPLTPRMYYSDQGSHALVSYEGQEALEFIKKRVETIQDEISVVGLPENPMITAWCTELLTKVQELTLNVVVKNL